MLIKPTGDQQVGKIDPRRAHLQAHLAGLQRPPRQVRRHETIGAIEAGTYHRPIGRCLVHELPLDLVFFDFDEQRLEAGPGLGQVGIGGQRPAKGVDRFPRLLQRPIYHAEPGECPEMARL